jgi:hypothetical protein
VNTPTKPHKIKLNRLNHRGFLCPLQLYDVFVFWSFIVLKAEQKLQILFTRRQLCEIQKHWKSFKHVLEFLLFSGVGVSRHCYTCMQYCIWSDVWKGLKLCLASIASVSKQVNCECCGNIPCMYESRFKVLCLNPAFPFPFSTVNIFSFIN